MTKRKIDQGNEFLLSGSLRMEDGKMYAPKDDDPVHCPDHNVTVRWGDLDGIQQLAVADGIDIAGDDCILKLKS
jgi:hypothetical protein